LTVLSGLAETVVDILLGDFLSGLLDPFIGVEDGALRAAGHTEGGER
jgi:hypothetical protein